MVIKSFKDEEAPMNMLIAHIMFDQIRGIFVSTNSDQVTEMNVSVILFSPKPDPRQAANILSSRNTKGFSRQWCRHLLWGTKTLIYYGSHKG